jgi:hypothetical protein
MRSLRARYPSKTSVTKAKAHNVAEIANSFLLGVKSKTKSSAIGMRDSEIAFTNARPETIIQSYVRAAQRATTVTD